MMLMGGNVEWDFSATSNGKVDPYTIGFQTITSDASDYAEFSFRTGKFVEKKKSLLLSQKPVFNYKQGQWVYVKYGDRCHSGIV